MLEINMLKIDIEAYHKHSVLPIGTTDKTQFHTFLQVVPKPAKTLKKSWMEEKGKGLGL